MLKIATVSWKGRCPRHPSYDPAQEAGPPGCSKCEELAVIHAQHQGLLDMLRRFGRMREAREIIRPDLQASLFE